MNTTSARPDLRDVPDEILECELRAGLEEIARRLGDKLDAPDNRALLAEADRLIGACGSAFQVDPR